MRKLLVSSLVVASLAFSSAAMAAASAVTGAVTAVDAKTETVTVIITVDKKVYIFPPPIGYGLDAAAGARDAATLTASRNCS